MHRVGKTGYATTRFGRRAAFAVVSLAAVTGLAACTSGTAGGDDSSAPAGSAAPGSTSAAPTSKAAAAAAVISVAPATADGSRISPSDPVTVKIANGSLTSVTMTNPAGKTVKGKMATDGSSWSTAEDLGYDKTYKISAAGRNADNAVTTKKTSVTTLSPNNQTKAYLYRIGDYPLTNGAKYGVGIVPVVHFDEPISDRAAAQKALSVTTTPHVDGVWSWTDDQNVHFRPQHYWPAGTKVTVSADIYGVRVGKGLYGESDESRSFTIGRRQVTIAHDDAPKKVNKVRVYNAAGKVLRTMNTAMGMHGGTTANGQYINFYTLDGTYTVLGHEQPAKMCSASYGLPANAPGGYACEDIYNATKISIDGIYLHYLNTFYAQDHGEDVSHGCLNLNEANSRWFFNHSMVGDPVEIRGAKHAPTIQVWQGGDWTVSWAKWVKGSAL